MLVALPRLTSEPRGYARLSAQTALDYVELLEQPAFRDMILCETVLEAVRPHIETAGGVGRIRSYACEGCAMPPGGVQALNDEGPRTYRRLRYDSANCTHLMPLTIFRPNQVKH